MTFSGKVIFKDKNGTIVSKPNDTKIEIRPSSDNWNLKIEFLLIKMEHFQKQLE